MPICQWYKVKYIYWSTFTCLCNFKILLLYWCTVYPVLYFYSTTTQILRTYSSTITWKRYLLLYTIVTFWISINRLKNIYHFHPILGCVNFGYLNIGDKYKRDATHLYICLCTDEFVDLRQIVIQSTLHWATSLGSRWFSGRHSDNISCAVYTK